MSLKGEICDFENCGSIEIQFGILSSRINLSPSWRGKRSGGGIWLPNTLSISLFYQIQLLKNFLNSMHWQLAGLVVANEVGWFSIDYFSTLQQL